MTNQTVKPGLVVAGFGFMGIILAVLLQYLANNGYVINEYLQGTITLQGVQICTVILALLISVVVAILTTK